MNTLSIEHLRAAWAEKFAVQCKTLKRSDIVTAFGISAATASTAIAYLLQHNPGFLRYDNAAKAYTWTGRPAKLKRPEWMNLFMEASA